MRIKIGNEGRYNFHNIEDINIIVKAENYIYDQEEKTVTAILLTPSQVKRIKNHFCGISDCSCGSGPAGLEQTGQDEFIIHLED